MKLHELAPVAGSTFEGKRKAVAMVLATARPVAVATRVSTPAPAARLALVSKVARCLWFAAFPSAVSTTFSQSL